METKTQVVRLAELATPLADIAILVATPKERDAVLTLMRDAASNPTFKKVLAEKAVYYLGEIGLYEVVLTMCEAGSVGRAGSALAASEMLRIWQPRVLLLVGIAFGAGDGTRKSKPRQVLGDVLVSTKVLLYEKARVGSTDTIQRGAIPEAGQALIARARNLSFTWTPKNGGARHALFGGILSGEKLVDSLAFKRKLLQSFPEAIGGEMEASGAYSAAATCNVEWLLIKAVCDWADGSKNDKAHGLAASNAAAFAKCLLEEPGLDSLQRAQVLDQGQTVGTMSVSAMLASDFRREILKAMSARMESARDVERLAAAYNSTTPDSQLRCYQDSERDRLLVRRAAECEAWLNAYEIASQHFLDGKISEQDFRRLYRQEIIDLCTQSEGDHWSMLTRQDRQEFTAIWAAFDRMKST